MHSRRDALCVRFPMKGATFSTGCGGGHDRLRGVGRVLSPLRSKSLIAFGSVGIYKCSSPSNSIHAGSHITGRHTRSFTLGLGNKCGFPGRILRIASTNRS